MLKILWLSNFVLHDTSSSICCYAKTMLEQMSDLLTTQVQIKVVASLANHTHLNGIKGFLKDKNLKDVEIYSFNEHNIDYYYAKCSSPNVAKHVLKDRQLLFKAYAKAREDFVPDVIISNGLNFFLTNILAQARTEGIKTVYFMSNERYKDYCFIYYDQIWTDLKHIANYSNDNIAANSIYVGSFVDVAKAKAKNPKPKYVSFIKPTVNNGLAYFAKIAYLAQTRFPQIRFLVIDSFSNFTKELCELKEKQADGSFIKPYNIAKFNNIDISEHTDDISTIFDNTKVLISPCLDNDESVKEIIEALSNNLPILSSNLPSRIETIHSGGLCLPIVQSCIDDPYLLPSDSDVDKWLVSLEKVEKNYNKAAQLCTSSFKRLKLNDNVKKVVELLNILCHK